MLPLCRQDGRAHGIWIDGDGLRYQDRSFKHFIEILWLAGNFPRQCRAVLQNWTTFLLGLEKPIQVRTVSTSRAVPELRWRAAEGVLPYAYAVAGRTHDAQTALASCLDRWRRERVGAICMALGYVGLKRPDEAFLWLEQELQARTATIYMLKAFPYWDPLRADPRFPKLLRRAGLPS